MIFPCCCTTPGLGFKVVHARKRWVGRAPFDGACDGEPDGLTCGINSFPSYEPLRPTAPQTLYRTVRREIKYNFQRTVKKNYIDCGQPGDSVDEIFINYIIEVTVDRFTGARIVTDCLAVLETSGFCWSDGSVDSIYRSICYQSMRLDAACGRADWHDDPAAAEAFADYLFSYRSGENGADPNLITVNELKPTTLDFVVECKGQLSGASTWSGKAEINVQLSDPYTAAACRADCEELAGLWRLNDDVHYPWRKYNDEGNSTGPLVEYAGAIVSNPDTVAKAFTGSCAESWYQGMISDPANYPTSYETPVNLNLEITGEIIGAPIDGQIWSAGGANTATRTFYGAQLDFPGIDRSDNYTLYVTKFAETKSSSLPAHNYARPCGADASTTASPPPEGDGLQHFLNCLPCAERDCNSTAQRGDFVSFEWLFNPREWQEAHRVRLQNMDLNTYGCGLSVPNEVRYWQGTHGVDRGIYQINGVQHTKAANTVIYCSPNAETFSQPSYNLGWFQGDFAFDTRYSNQWVKQCRQIMPDPLRDLCGVPYPDATMEEFRLEVPAGCPTLPPGALMGYLTVADLDTPNDVEDGLIVTPGGSYGTYGTWDSLYLWP